MDKWTEYLEQGGQIDVMYSDFEKAVATFTASRKRSHVAIFTATVAVNIATWLCLRLPLP